MKRSSRRLDRGVGGGVSTTAGGGARAPHDSLVPLTRALFAEPNPVVIKAVLAARGRIPTPEVRLPLLATDASSVTAALEPSDQAR